MIVLNKQEARHILEELKLLYSQTEALDAKRKVPNHGSGDVNSDLRELAFVTDAIRQSLAVLIQSSTAFLENYIEQMTEKDEGIAEAIRKAAAGSEGDAK